ncbi:MAG: OB-fold domain-containing protein [Deltaproteobacteria bacterium]|nr:OB-fold domain-containing protein [Deltaproteobacteria bacterium]
MIGITSYGGYVPRYRLDRSLIFGAMGWFNGATAGVARGEKAVANYDEDTITMAVSAAMGCLGDIPRKEVDGIYACSTTFPYIERQNAAICASAMDFRHDVRSADFSSSTRSGTTALLSACEAVSSGNVNNILVAASDSRLGKPGSSDEHTFGDGAGALLIGNEGVIAELKGSYTVTRDFADYRRIQGERFQHTWEERWIRDEGYGKIIPEAALGLAQKYNVKASDFAKIIIACPAAVIKGLTKVLGAQPEQMQDNLGMNVGNTGAALPLMMLVAALEEAKPGDKLLVLSYGSGSDALYFEVTEEIEQVRNRAGISGHLAIRKELDNYAKYLVFRDLLPVEIGIRGEETAMARMSVIYREDRTMAVLCGSRCTVCGTPQYPKQRVCINPACGATDQMEDYCFSDKVGRINSYTGDNLAFSLDPPAMYGLIDFEEGGRLYLDITDAELDELAVGTPVKMTFRRKFSDKRRGTYSYFWKATPVTQENK